MSQVMTEMSATLCHSGMLDGALIRLTEAGTTVGGWRVDVDSHLLRWGPRVERAGAAGRELRREVELIGLTGRGGGHFPVAVKWNAALAAGPGGQIVVNAAEGEPGSGKDSVLWQLRPHLVLDGAANIAEVFAAREVVIWLHADAAATRASIDQALAERRAAGFADPPVRVLLAPEGYTSGESSAVIAGVRGEPVAPIFTPDPARPWGEGPAILVHNTETVARIGLLGHTGAADYPATSLITIAVPGRAARIAERFVLEVSEGATVESAITAAGLPVPDAFLLGGFAGSWHRSEEASRLPLDQGLLRERGLSLGAGIIYCLPKGRTVLEEATAIAEWLADQSAGQCGPCVFGMPEMVKSMKRGRHGHARQLALIIEGRGGCRMPDGAIRMVRSAWEMR